MVTIVDADARRWDDLAELIGERGDPSRCWCQYYRSPDRYEHGDRDRNRAAMRQQVTTATVPHGVLAYDGERPVGWCAVAPRGDYPRLERMQGARATSDEDGLWSVTCFVVRVGHRRQGVATQLLRGAVDLARRHGARIVEAYPIDTSRRPAGAASLYQGPLSLYRRAGFVEVARPTESRAIVRLDLSR
ncbi:GNAT family N-acetyltransferase [Rugosimonospora africana]|uniref:N-acetyltransferase GCN5 n=1 Tax=Rugosimonospora africana TaxID=556532 RepID=A0A8J3VRV3_9ACTN|nr:GNAT family N-acetyltransferase [Rugosimonospora africana]GIH15866.1 N-acetyltransferase GCN5 [Rugosimonospora africana]